MGPGLAELAAAARPGGTLVTAGWLDPRPAPMPINAPLTIYRYMKLRARPQSRGGTADSGIPDGRAALVTPPDLA